MENRKKTDYYEVLGVLNNATLDEIKIAYKKRALELHPDKNIEHPEIAAEKFKELQNAYSVLKDPNERAWYDSHKSSILRGEDTEEEASEGFNLWPYFSTSCFSTYGDSKTGFYNVYRNVFEELDREEEDEELEDEYHEKAPSFGDSETPIKEVLKFYNYWSNFATKRSFDSFDKYNLNEGPNRYIRRAMEKENKKERDKARKKRNDEVRHLTEFVKRYDKRYHDYQKKLKIEQQLKKDKEEEDSKLRKLAQQEERQRQQVERQKMLEEELNLQDLHILKDYTNTEEKEELQLHCLVCNKYFKSEKQFQSHERSKSHKQKLQLMKDELLIEGEDILPSSPSNTQDNAPSEDNTQNTEEEINNAEEEVLEEEEEEDDIPSKSARSKKQQKKKKKNVINLMHIDSDSDNETPLPAKEEKELKSADSLKEKQNLKNQKKEARKLKKEQKKQNLEENSKCTVCNQKFSSRNLLFAHITEMNHATLKKV